MANIKLSIAVLIILLSAALMVAGCRNSPEAPGTLRGTVSIGPIWPVERPGENPPVPPQVFQGRKVIIYNKSQTQVLQTVNLLQIDATAEASYLVQLKPGSYTVDINRNGMDSSSEVPARVEIRSGETVIIDINIDTGIR